MKVDFFQTVLSFCCLAEFPKLVGASNGDRSYVFGKCVNQCFARNCSNLTDFASKQPTHLQVLQWTCLDECKYHCMWTTVEAYRQDNSKVPQFYGKWPFVRYAGIQEPASMIFSILNGLSHLAILEFRRRVSPLSNMYVVWHGMAGVGMFTWSCAAAFHTRDTPFTEKLDYFSAFALVLYNLFTLLCRVLGTDKKGIVFSMGAVLVGIYCYHIHYLAFVHFDYGYNMVVNIAAGAINALGWIAWCIINRSSRPYVWKCVTVMLGLNLLLLLELGDFPPFFWVFDAHAIWHAGTVPLNLLWYSFIIDDGLFSGKARPDEDVKKLV